MNRQIEQAKKIKDKVSDLVGLDLSDRYRGEEFMAFKQAFAYLIYETTNLSVTHVADIIGVDHSNISHYKKIHNTQMRGHRNKHKIYREAVKYIQRLIDTSGFTKEEESRAIAKATANTIISIRSIYELQIKRIEKENYDIRNAIAGKNRSAQKTKAKIEKLQRENSILKKEIEGLLSGKGQKKDYNPEQKEKIEKASRVQGYHTRKNDKFTVGGIQYY